MKKKASVIILISVLLIALMGCGSKKPLETSYKDYSSNGATQSADEPQPIPEEYNINSYLYWPDNSRFTVVAVEHIEDGTNNGITIRTLADRKTKVMYLLTEKYQSGYGISMDVLVDANGKPMIYDGVVK